MLDHSSSEEDEWLLTSEPVRKEDVEAFLRLLSLPVKEGLVLDFRTDGA